MQLSAIYVLSFIQRLLNLMTITSHDTYIKLIVSSLDYCRDCMSRLILSKGLTATSEVSFICQSAVLLYVICSHSLVSSSFSSFPWHIVSSRLPLWSSVVIRHPILSPAIFVNDSTIISTLLRSTSFSSVWFNMFTTPLLARLNQSSRLHSMCLLSS